MSEGGVWVLEIGSSLREARGRRRLTLERIAAETRIPVHHLEALEQERFDDLPEDPYRRSFLREYAEFLGLDGDLYTREYDRRFRPQEPEWPLRRVQPPGYRSGRQLWFPPWLLVLVAVLAVLALAIWRLSSSGGRQPAPSPATTPISSAQTATAARKHKPPAPATPQRRPLLNLTATRGNCWLWVRSGSSRGTTLYEQTLPQGASIRFRLRTPLWIRVGAPWNLDATLGARSLTALLPTRTGDILVTPGGLVSTG